MKAIIITAVIRLLLVLILFISGCTRNDTVIPAVSDDGMVKPEITDTESIQKEENVKRSYAHVAIDDTVVDIVNHPAFKGFGQFILPLDRRMYDQNMQLDHVASLLPYHGHVDPAAAVAAINYMIDAVNNGNKIFYDFYAGRQKQSDPTKESTGLFFFRGKPGAPFAIVCPGGGFSYVGSVHEGFPHAIELSKKRYNAFVLQYRVGGESIACEDLAAALSYIFKNADMLAVDIEDYSIWGSSAGARMAARLGSYGAAAFGGDNLPKPGTVVIAYTGHSDFTKTDPPSFVIVSENDPIASVSTVERRVEAMRNAGIEVEYRKYKNAGHGFGLGVGTDAEGWIEYAIRFWENHISK